MQYDREHILEQQKHFVRLGIEHIPYAQMITPQRHLIDGYTAITTSMSAIGIPAGYIGVNEQHPLHGLSDNDVCKLEDDLGIVYAGKNPHSIDVMKGESPDTWYFGIDTGNNLKATRQDLIEHLRSIAVFLNSRVGGPN